MQKLTLQESIPLIKIWADNKDLIHKKNAGKQRLKLIEECGELANAILKNNIKSQKDAIGDIFVVLVILSFQIKQVIDIDCKKTDYINNDILDNLQGLMFNKSINKSFIYLYEICSDLNLDLTECVNIAYNEIKNRTGKTIGGTFIKD